MLAHGLRWFIFPLWRAGLERCFIRLQEASKQYPLNIYQGWIR